MSGGDLTFTYDGGGLFLDHVLEVTGSLHVGLWDAGFRD